MPFELSNAIARDLPPVVLSMEVPSAVGREIQLHHKGDGPRTIDNATWHVPTPAAEDGIGAGWLCVEPDTSTVGAVASFIRGVWS